MEEVIQKETSKKILIVDHQKSLCSDLLRTYLKKYGYEIFTSSKIPLNIESFSKSFIFDNVSIFEYITKKSNIDISLIITEKKSLLKRAKQIIENNKYPNIKVLFAPQYEGKLEQIVEKILWFSLSRSNERYLNLERAHHSKIIAKKNTITKKDKHFFITPFLIWQFDLFFTPINLMKIFFIFLFIYHTVFIPFLVIGTYFSYQSTLDLKGANLEKAVLKNKRAESSLFIGKKLYSLCRPTYLLFSIANIPDDIFNINSQIALILKTSTELKSEATTLSHYIMKKDKTTAEQLQTIDMINKLKTSLDTIEEQLTFLQQKLPPSIPQLKKGKDTLTNTIQKITKLKKIYPFLSNILAQNGQKKYLLLFANNMELRPGGGFIGSFGILSLKNLSISDFKVYDVYDADGQLMAHIDPPEAIKKYLFQPHWFLRDSAFSPDFYENYNNARFFLEKEMNISDFDGAILLTTTAVKNILEAFDSIYIPDFDEKVNKDNFYLKTQIYAEKGFFPGSIQKKGFLAALARQIFLNLENVSPALFLQNILRSLEEKQLVLYLENTDLQKRIDSLYWSGRIIESTCPAGIENCYTNFLFPFDANLGVNKANFFIFRTIETTVTFDSDGFIHTRFTINYKNESQTDVFPGGIYKNYFQILLPRNTILEQISLNNNPMKNYDTELKQFKKVGLYFELPSQKTTNITIEYRSLTKLIKGKAVYQLLIQKQIGSMNNDFSLHIVLPEHIYVTNQNFSPLVKRNEMLYNTDLSTDKVFFIELLKE